MRAAELLFEFNYLERLDGDLNDLLIAGKAAGVKSIDISQLTSQLRQMGFSVTDEALRSYIENIEFVTVSGDEIRFVGDEDAEGDIESNDVEKNKERVQQMAQKATSKDIGK